MSKKSNLNSSDNFKKIISMISIIIFIFVIIIVYTDLKSYKNINSIKNNKSSGINSKDNLNNNKNSKKDKKDIINIALFGVDTGREKNEAAHSDSIIIATIDYKHNKIKLSSILRDTYVDVEGHGKTKINEAYAFGGPQLAIKTLNQNFKVNIKDYVTVNFFTLEKIVDTLGGIDIDIKKNEINEINNLIKEVAKLENKTPKLITKSGIQNINGIQAVAYSRMRSVGNGDFERSERQGNVLNELLKKVQNIKRTQYTSILLEILPYFDTSIKSSDILKLANSIIENDISIIERERFPQDGYCKGEFINGIWYLVAYPSIETTSIQIRDYIYNDIRPVLKEPLF